MTRDFRTYYLDSIRSISDLFLKFDEMFFSVSSKTNIKMEKARPRLMPVNKQPQSPESKPGEYELEIDLGQIDKIDGEILHFETLLKQARCG
jgi:hypothetical protein